MMPDAPAVGARNNAGSRAMRMVANMLAAAPMVVIGVVLGACKPGMPLRDTGDPAAPLHPSCEPVLIAMRAASGGCGQSAGEEQRVVDYDFVSACTRQCAAACGRQ